MTEQLHAKPDSYLTKTNPTIEDWLDFNKPLFADLKAGKPVGQAMLVALTDFDIQIGETDPEQIQAAFDELVAKVGDLGVLKLHLDYSDIDDAWHVIFGLADKEPDVAADLT